MRLLFFDGQVKRFGMCFGAYNRERGMKIGPWRGANVLGPDYTVGQYQPSFLKRLPGGSRLAGEGASREGGVRQPI
jgi:hypothetical protein